MSKCLDPVATVKEMKASLYSLNLNAARWRKFKSPLALDWKQVQFGKQNAHLVPKTRGVYAFSMVVGDHNLPPHGYVLYVGITGDASQATLKSRFAQYTTALNRTKCRPRVRYMLTEWEGSLVFNYVEVPDAKVGLRPIEVSLLDALLPIVNSRDFSASIQQGRSAFV